MPHKCYNLLARLLCLPVRSRSRARPQISRPFNAQAGNLCSYRRARCSSSFVCVGVVPEEEEEEEEPASPAWTVAAYERDSFCLVMEEAAEEEEEEEVEVVDSPTLPARCGSCTLRVSRGEKEKKKGEVEVGSIDFSGSYYGRLGREWVS